MPGRFGHELPFHPPLVLQEVFLPAFLIQIDAAILRLNREVLERGARALLDKETLDEAAIRALAMDLRRIDVMGAAP